ncbi:MAG: signal peptide peptidase SppA [Bacteroidales bacterium]|nr:signal peptide peptidase SppA [Bacteroidales bacterium]
MRRLFLVIIAALLAAASAYAGSDGFLKGKVLRIDKETVAEVGSEGSPISISLPVPGLSLGGSAKLSLLDVELALKQAAKDDDIAMIYFNYDNFSAPTSACEEIRRYIREFSEAGKPVVAYGCSLGNGPYYMASAADRIFLNPKGSGSLNGLASQQYFLKDLLDTLGVEVKLIRHGKFKSAGEMYIRNSMSPENRQQYQDILEATWSTMVEQMAASRGIEASQLREWISNLELGTADTWMDKGLIDGLKYKDEMEDYICHLFGTTEPDAVKRVNLKEYVKKVKKGSGKKVAVLYADGEISRDGNEIAGEKFAAQIAKIRKDESIKAVVFRVNSPGGEVVAADIIRREMELLCKEKPVVASYSSYAASGGYWISVGCNKIFCDNTTLTGSIGVFGMVPNVSKAASKVLKVNFETVKSDPHAGAGGIFTGLDAEEEAWYQKEIEDIYTNFLNVVAAGRDMTPEKVDDIAQGRVWAGKDALKIGLVDETGSLLDAIDYIAKEAGLSKYKIVVAPEKQKGFGMNKDKKEKPLVHVQDMLSQPGFRAMAIMPFMTVDPENPFAL